MVAEGLFSLEFKYARCQKAALGVGLASVEIDQNPHGALTICSPGNRSDQAQRNVLNVRQSCMPISNILGTECQPLEMALQYPLATGKS